MYDPATGQSTFNNWHGTFPMGRGLPARPNPLARALPTQTVKADINGIQQAMNKRADERSPSDIAKNILPGGLAAGLADFIPGFSSSRYRQGKAQEIAHALGQTIPFELKRPAISQGLYGGLGAVGGQILGRGNPLTAALGGIGGNVYAGLRRHSQIEGLRQDLENRLAAGGNLKLNKPMAHNAGGLLGSGSMDAGKIDAYLALKNKQPINPRTILGSMASDLSPGVLSSLANKSYARGRLASEKQSAESCGGSMNRSSAGEGKIKYKVGDDDLKKGDEAFKTLDNYMKKAGLNSFQTNFFGRLIQQGYGASQIKTAVDLAIAKFGEKVASDLSSGLEKLSFVKAITQFGRGLVQPGLSMLENVGGRMVQPAANAAGQAVRRNAGRLAQQFANVPGAATRDLLTGKGAFTGALTGLVNPVTGMSGGEFFDNEGNITTGSVLSGLGSAATRAGIGAATGRLGYRLGGKQFGRTMENIQNRAMSGQALGGIAGLGSDAMGLTDNAAGTLSNIGYFGGALAPNRLNRIPGLKQLSQNANTPGFIKNMLNTTTAGLGTNWKANALVGGAGLAGAGAIGAGKGLYNLSQLPGQIRDSLQNANQLMANAQQTMQPLQNLSQFYQQNQGMINPMMQGLAGAGAGYMMGGMPGAAAGGIGLPLVMQMLSQGGQGNPFGLAGAGGAGNYLAHQNLMNRGATQLPDELARQQAYQQGLMRNAGR